MTSSTLQGRWEKRQWPRQPPRLAGKAAAAMVAASVNVAPSRQVRGRGGCQESGGGSGKRGKTTGGSCKAGFDEASAIRCGPSSTLPPEVMWTLARRATPPPSQSRPLLLAAD
uniref:Uncharacterized protein n=1 Tax=Oryza glumipatula TaxID=40148 RepID=A0A0D9ZI25_9ORYZ